MTRESQQERKRCHAKIYVRDTYRRTGRGRSGFEMHYSEQQCSRAAITGDLCKQHAQWEERGGGKLSRCDWHEFVEPRKRKEQQA